MTRLVTLTTDFGTGSVYVAQMKGVLLSGATPPTLVDLCHDAPAHDLRAAAWFAARACLGFPPGSIHLIVVDPGVGTARRLLHARIGGHDFLAPDNGVLSLAIRRAGLEWARDIPLPSGAAATFHGRDAFAPYARVLAGAPASGAGEGDAFGDSDAGRRVEPVLLEWPEPKTRDDGAIEGEVIHVDAFGNLVTNLPASLLPRLLAAGAIRVGERTVSRVVRTYGEAPRGSLVALLGSQEALEVAVVEGRASDRLGAGVGTPVTLPVGRPG